MNSSPDTTAAPVALVTGDGSGIGAAVARRLLDTGCRVTVTGRGEERLRAFAAELGEPEGLLTVVDSTSDYDHVQSAVDRALKEFGRLDTVVANAGTATHDSVADWTDMVLTNVPGPAFLVRASVDALRKTRGRRAHRQRRRLRAHPGQPLRGDDGGTARSSGAESGGGLSPASPRTPAGRSPSGASASPRSRRAGWRPRSGTATAACRPGTC